MYCHDLEVIGLNPGRVKLGIRSISPFSCTLYKNVCKEDRSVPK